MYRLNNLGTSDDSRYYPFYSSLQPHGTGQVSVQSRSRSYLTAMCPSTHPIYAEPSPARPYLYHLPSMNIPGCSSHCRLPLPSQSPGGIGNANLEPSCCDCWTNVEPAFPHVENEKRVEYHKDEYSQTRLRLIHDCTSEPVRCSPIFPPNDMRKIYFSHHAHSHFPRQPPPHRPSYSNTNPCAETWNAPSPPLTHSGTNHGVPPPQPYGGNSPLLCLNGSEQEGVNEGKTIDPNCPLPPKVLSDRHAQNVCSGAKPSFEKSMKSVRRRKKMYSDFVGVTFNKTHAKYQACITHYRKQHYLGRYKLAVDAALAYDESAKLLKGSSWKVNFPTRQSYEDAKLRELKNIGICDLDVAGSLAAVALKVEEITSNVSPSAAMEKPGRTEPVSQMLSSTQLRKTLYDCHVRKLQKKPIPAGVSPQQSDHLTLTKVTPSSICQNHRTWEDHESMSTSKNSSSLQTPLPASPDPARHVMDAEKGTPESVIQPTVLNYPCKSGKALDMSVLHLKGADTAGQLRHGKPTVSLNTKKADLKVVKEATPQNKPHVIQNGTLAAASALMTLFGNEDIPKGGVGAAV